MKVVASPLRKKLARKPASNQWKDLLPTNVPEEAEEGFETSAQIAEQINLHPDHVRKLLSALVAKGKVESRKFKVEWSIYPVTHYRKINRAEAKQSQEHCRHR